MTQATLRKRAEDRGWAFRPSTLEAGGIRVWFKRRLTIQVSWRSLRFEPAFLHVNPSGLNMDITYDVRDDDPSDTKAVSD